MSPRSMLFDWPVVLMPHQSINPDTAVVAATAKTQATAIDVQGMLPSLAAFENLMDKHSRLANPQLATAKYELGTMISRGGFASVHVCMQRRGGRASVYRSRRRSLFRSSNGGPGEVAKISTAHPYEEFRMEVAVLCLVGRHPNIVAFKEAFVSKNLWIVLERMEGDLRTLSHVGAWGESFLACCMKQALTGLQVLHDMHICHRDIKLDNMLWDAQGFIKIADFGLCGVLTKETPQLMDEVGTPGYRSPEIIDRLPYGANTDVWSLGVCAMELCLGYAQRWDEYDGQMLPSSMPFPLFNARRVVSRHFFGFVMDALQKDPAQRSSCAQLLKHTFVTHKACTRAELKPFLLAMQYKAQLHARYGGDDDDDNTNTNSNRTLEEKEQEEEEEYVELSADV